MSKSQVIALVNQKGGTGKTQSTENLGVGLASEGKKVLLVDMDPQGSLGVWGVVNLLEGYGNDNPGAKSQGMKQLMAGGGVALIGTQLIPLLSGLF